MLVCLLAIHVTVHSPTCIIIQSQFFFFPRSVTPNYEIHQLQVFDLNMHLCQTDFLQPDSAHGNWLYQTMGGFPCKIITRGQLTQSALLPGVIAVGILIDATCLLGSLNFLLLSEKFLHQLPLHNILGGNMILKQKVFVKKISRHILRFESLQFMGSFSEMITILTFNVLYHWLIIQYC